jgi:SpoVK/Ycf46/Vps4 family AAA+-type ATPase
MLGGLDALKEFTLASLRSRADKSLFPKGVLLTGVPGTGKTAIAKCLGREVDLPVVEFRLGKLLGKYIGDSEHAISHTLKVIERMAPVILVIDEIEKAISGGSNSGSASDGGVMRRILGTILTWLQDKTSEVYVIGTCNDIASLPPELSRAGRFDAVFFLDFPGSQQRRKIWNIYRKQHSIPETDKTPNDNGWTGTEIEQCCYMARMLGRSLTESASFIVPIGRSSRDKLEKLREYAEGRFLDATRGGLYDPKNTDILLSDPTPAGTGRRRVRTDLLETPTNNNNNSN